MEELRKQCLLELLDALGVLRESIVLAGGHALEFVLGPGRARPTHDFDLVVNVIQIRAQAEVYIPDILTTLGYRVIPKARYFQFEKHLSETESLRIDFMGPQELAPRKNDIRVRVQEGLHARACRGGAYVLEQSQIYELAGVLPNGKAFSASIRVADPSALLLLKVFALHDQIQISRSTGKESEAAIHAYDLYLLLEDQRIRTQAAAAFKASTGSQHWSDVEEAVAILRILFADEFREGPRLIAQERAERARRTSQVDTKELQAYRLDAVQTVQAFLKETTP